MAASPNPLHVPLRPWHTLGLDYLTYMHVSNSFDNMLILVDHLTPMANFLSCTKTSTNEEILLRDIVLNGNQVTTQRCWSSSIVIGRL
jgi:hypothetical protein